MSFQFGPQRIEKMKERKNLFKQQIMKQPFLYDNIVNQILLFVTDGYNDIKNYLNIHNEYYKYMKQIHSKDHNEPDDNIDDDDNNIKIKNPKNISIHQQLKTRLLDYYSIVLQNENITCLLDLIGLFIDCSSLFTNRPIEKIGAYCYSSSKYTGLTPSFIKFDHMYHDIIVNFIQLDQQLDLSFDISLMDKNDSAFCKIIRMLLINLVSKIYEWVQNPLLFDGKYFVINGKKPRFIFNLKNLFFQMYFILKK